MRVAFPDRIPLGKAVACAVGLAVIQLFQHSAPSFVLLFFAFIVLSVMAFNHAGGFSRPSGVYIFWFALLAVVFGVVMKAFFGEPAHSNLQAPQTTMTVYVCTMLMMWLAAAISRKVTGNSPGLALLLGTNKINLRYSAVGCMAVGVLFILINQLIRQSAGSLLAALNQINYFLPLGIILGTVGALETSKGERSTNYFVLLSIGASFLWGLVQFSKQGMFTPFVAWGLAAFHMRMRLRPIHYVSIITFAVLAVEVLSPIAAAGRDDVTPGMSYIAKFRVAEGVLENLGQVKQDLDADIVKGQENGGDKGYYNEPRGLIDRLSMVPNDDSLIAFTSQGHVLGYAVVRANFENWIPHFLMPNKNNEVVGGGNYYEHEMGNLPDNDTTTGISFSPAAEAFHLGAWKGIFLVLPLILTMMFVVFDWLLGDMRRHALGILVILLFGHLAPEGGITGPIYETMFGSVTVIGAILFCVYVAPILGAAVFLQKHASSDPAAI